MCRKYGKLPHELLLQPYGNFLIDFYVYVIGSGDVDDEVMAGAKGEPIATILGLMREQM